MHNLKGFSRFAEYRFNLNFAYSSLYAILLWLNMTFALQSCLVWPFQVQCCKNNNSSRMETLNSNCFFYKDQSRVLVLPTWWPCMGLIFTLSSLFLPCHLFLSTLLLTLWSSIQLWLSLSMGDVDWWLISKYSLLMGMTFVLQLFRHKTKCWTNMIFDLMMVIEEKSSNHPRY